MKRIIWSLCFLFHKGSRTVLAMIAGIGNIINKLLLHRVYHHPIRSCERDHRRKFHDGVTCLLLVYRSELSLAYSCDSLSRRFQSGDS